MEIRCGKIAKITDEELYELLKHWFNFISYMELGTKVVDEND